MANENITPVSLTNIELFQNGERANATNLNRPVIQIRNNQIEQNRMLNEIYALLGATDINLDQLQELIDKIHEFQATLASDDVNFDDIQEIVNQVKKHKNTLERGLLKNNNKTGDGTTDTFACVFYKDSIMVFIEGIKIKEDDITLNYDSVNPNLGESITLNFIPNIGDDISIVTVGTVVE